MIDRPITPRGLRTFPRSLDPEIRTSLPPPYSGGTRSGTPCGRASAAGGGSTVVMSDPLLVSDRQDREALASESRRWKRARVPPRRADPLSGRRRNGALSVGAGHDIMKREARIPGLVMASDLCSVKRPTASTSRPRRSSRWRAQQQRRRHDDLHPGLQLSLYLRAAA